MTIAIQILGYLWSTLNTLIGLLLALLYRPVSWRWSAGCLEAVAGSSADGKTRIIGRPWAQTFGWLIFYDSAEHRGYAPIRVHERVHVKHGMILGPMFLVAYVGHWLWLMAFPPVVGNEPAWLIAYRQVWSEVIAYRYQAEFEAGQHPDAWGANQ